ncbi:MAG: hypothetical protein A2Y12_08760 [Planctomycetes bacterium GWF2_42_9]|nr:MAG: hypothetical protein A2Y12_08760 [Planctomycetes bacterium GWF2_42_9]HAL45488.1 hypothetical protein [Phycisphaerales bacterium]
MNMRIFGLIILKARDYDAARKADNATISKLLEDKNSLIASCEKLIEINKSRQQGRALARRMEKNARQLNFQHSTSNV